MQVLNDWFNEQSQTPAGSILVFLGIFLFRIAIDEWFRRREKRKNAKQRGKALG